MKYLLIFTIAFAMMGCDKPIIEKESTNTSILSARNERPVIRIRKGTYLHENCSGGGDCGPCPGICVKFWWNSRSIDTLTQEEFENGDRLAFVENIDSDHITLSFTSFDVIFHDSFTRITENIKCNSELANELGFSEIKILAGVYNVDYTNNQFGTCKFDIVTIP